MLTVSLLVCAMMALATADDSPTESPSPCPEGWSEHSGHCYGYNSKELEWAAAEKHCLASRGNLASVHSAEEYQFIQKVIEESGGGNETWIGGSDCQQDNTWLWSDGKPFVFSLWCAGEPNNLGGNQSCLVMNHDDGKCWDDQECSSLHPSVCSLSL